MSGLFSIVASYGNPFAAAAATAAAATATASLASRSTGTSAATATPASSSAHHDRLIELVESVTDLFAVYYITNEIVTKHDKRGVGGEKSNGVRRFEIADHRPISVLRIELDRHVIGRGARQPVLHREDHLVFTLMEYRTIEIGESQKLGYGAKSYIAVGQLGVHVQGIVSLAVQRSNLTTFAVNQRPFVTNMEQIGGQRKIARHDLVILQHEIVDAVEKLSLV